MEHIIEYWTMDGKLVLQYKYTEVVRRRVVGVIQYVKE